MPLVQSTCKNAGNSCLPSIEHIWGIIYLVLRVIIIPISGLRRVMVKMWKDNRIKVGIWGQELGTGNFWPYQKAWISKAT
jgi:hypothetical protein